MTKRGRPLPTLLIATLLVFVAVGCGVETNDGAGQPSGDKVEVPTTTTEDTTETTEADTGPAGTTVPDDTTTPSLPGGMDEDFFKKQLEVGFKSAGLDDKQAACLADAYVKEFGTDTGSAGDFNAMLDLFTGCGIDPSELGGGGGG